MLKGFQGIAIEWVICLLALAFVLLRSYARWMNFTSSDWLLIVIWLLFLVGVSFDTPLFAQGFAKDGLTLDARYTLYSELPLQKVESGLKMLYAGAPIRYMVLWGVKIALLLFYYQLFPRHMHVLRWILHSTSFLVAGSLVVILFLNLFYCYPVNKNWNVMDRSNLCFAYNEDLPYYTTLGFHVTTDILIYILPLTLLYNLTLSPKKLWSVVFVFSLGFFCLLCAVARAICISVGSVSISTVWMFGALEQGSGIIVACCPALKDLLFGSDGPISRRRERLLSLAPRKGSVTSAWSKTRSRLDIVGFSLSKSTTRPETKPAEHDLGSKFEWDTEVESQSIMMRLKKPEAAHQRSGSLRPYNPADRHSGMAGGLAGAPSSTEPLIIPAQESDQELSIYRNLRQAYNVHLNINK